MILSRQDFFGTFIPMKKLAIVLAVLLVLGNACKNSSDKPAKPAAKHWLEGLWKVNVPEGFAEYAWSHPYYGQWDMQCKIIPVSGEPYAGERMEIRKIEGGYKLTIFMGGDQTQELISKSVDESGFEFENTNNALISSVRIIKETDVNYRQVIYKKSVGDQQEMRTYSFTKVGN